jgi:5-oxoprolinase (ATP-hydrolysing)
VLVQTPGLFGGRAGVLPGTAVRNSRDGQTVEIGIGALVTLTSPDEVAELRLAGGSGFGDPLQRSIEAVQSDLDGGYVTPQGARRDYGCVVGPDGLIDPGASRELRRILDSKIAKQPKAEARKPLSRLDTSASADVAPTQPAT